MRKTHVALALLIAILTAAPPASSTVSSIQVSIGYPSPGFTVTVDGDPGDWPRPRPLHGAVEIDGHIDDWGAAPDSANTYVVDGGEFIWSDAAGDLRSMNTSEVDADIVGFHVTCNATHLLMMVQLRDLGYIGDPSKPSIAILIPIDVDMNSGDGNRYLAYLSDTLVSGYAYWDYQVAVDLTNPAVKPYERVYGDGVEVWNGGMPLDIYDPGFNDVSTGNSSFAVGLFENAVEIAVAWSDLGITSPWNISNIRVYLATVKSNGYGEALEVDHGAGSDVLDVVSNQTTDAEVADGVIDYWLDIGLSRVPEPASYRHSVLIDDGLAVSWIDMTHDERRDYIPDEAFDTDLIEAAIDIDTSTSTLYMLFHIRGFADPTGDIYPAIAVVLDTTPNNTSDGVDSWIHAPPGWGNTDTELAGSSGLSANWTHIIWIRSDLATAWLMTPVNPAGSAAGTVAVKGHFIEASIDYTLIDPGLPGKLFRIEVLSFAYAANPVQLDNNRILGTNTPLYSSNAYDVVGPLPTWSSSGSVNFTGVNGEFYDDDDSINGTRYDPGTDVNEDHWIDTYTIKKYGVRIRDVTVSFTDYDGDSVLEIGEPMEIRGYIEYYDGTQWVAMDGYNASFALIGSYHYLGRNTSSNGTLLLRVDSPADTVPTGVYRGLIFTNETDTYYEASGVSNTTVNIVQRPFIPTLPEPGYIPMLLVAALLLLLMRRRS